MNWLPWRRHEGIDQQASKEAEEYAKEKLEDAFERWPDVVSLHIELNREKMRNHFSERWEREIRARASELRGH